MAEQLPGPKAKLNVQHPVSIAVIYTKQKSYAEEHVVVLQNNGVKAAPIQCKTSACFTTIDFSPFNRIYLLVDEAMCAILMKDEGLDKDSFVAFEEIGKCNIVVHAINHLLPGNGAFYNLIRKIPQNITVLYEGYMSTDANPRRGTEEHVKTTQSTTGMAGGRATDSNVIGTIHGDVHFGDVHLQQYDTYETRRERQLGFSFKRTETSIKLETDTSPRDQLQICINFADEIKEKLTENVQSKISSSDGIVKVDIIFGSIIIILTLEDGFVVTEKWIRGILKSLFNENLASCISEGEVFSVAVQRHLTIQGTDLPSLYGLLNNYRHHENCIPKEEHDIRIGSLQSEIKELKDEIKNIKEDQMTEAKVMLLYKHRTSKEDEGTSGIHSADDSISEPDADTDKDRKKVEEEKIPVESKKWDIEEGDMRLIISSRNAMLNEACRSGKVDIVKGIISAGGVDINNRSEGGLTPVMIAAWNGHKQLFDFLVEKGCDLSVILDNGNNILHVACFGGNVGIVDFIINSNTVDKESKGLFGRTAVMKAANVGQKKVFDLLVRMGSDLSGVDDTDHNILHLACLSDNVDIVQYLITHNIVDINSKGSYGRIPVMFTAAKGQKEVFDLLVRMGSDLSGVDNTGNNSLHLACFSDNVDIVQYLITHNIADINSKGRYGRTPVMTAAENGQKKVFDQLVRMGSDLSGVDNTGNNILHLACLSDDVDIVQHLITHDIADINSKGQYGRRPVMFAAEKGQKKVFDLLVRLGSVLSGEDNTGNNILHLACLSDNVDIVQYLITHNISDINSKGSYGRTPVMIAAEKGQKKVFDLLVRMGSDLSVLDEDGAGILHLAAMGGNVGVVEHILTGQTVDISRKDNRNWTPLQYARYMKQERAVSLLMARGAVEG